MDVWSKLTLIREGYSISDINSGNFMINESVNYGDVILESISTDINYFTQMTMGYISEADSEDSDGFIDRIKKFFKWIMTKIDQLIQWIKAKFKKDVAKSEETAEKVRKLLSSGEFDEKMKTKSKETKEFTANLRSKVFEFDKDLTKYAKDLIELINSAKSNVMQMKDIPWMDDKKKNDNTELKAAMLRKTFGDDGIYDDVSFKQVIFGDKTSMKITADLAGKLVDIPKRLSEQAEAIQDVFNKLKGNMDEFTSKTLPKYNRGTNTEFKAQLSDMTKVYSVGVNILNGFLYAISDIKTECDVALEEISKL